MDPARRRWYVGGIAVSIVLVAIAWGFTMWRVLSPEVAQIRESIGEGIDRAAEKIEDVRKE